MRVYETPLSTRTRVEGQHGRVADPQHAELALVLQVAGERELGGP